MNISTLVRLFALFFLTHMATYGEAYASGSQTSSPDGWPRQYSDGQSVLVLYQPQVDDWNEHTKISFRSAFSLSLDSSTKPKFGVLHVTADSTVDVAGRIVTLSNLNSEVRVADNDSDSVELIKSTVLKLLPDRDTIDVSLDRILVYVKNVDAKLNNVNVNLDPPPIFYSPKEAVLVNFIGKPSFQPISGSNLMAATNTNWDIIRDTDSGNYFMLFNESWLTTKDVEKGPWVAAQALPSSFSSIPDDLGWEELKSHIPGKPLSLTLPSVLVSEQPAELIITKGQPQFSPIGTTALMSVSNSDSVLFFHTKQKQYYYLVAGRWFRATALGGPWSAATFDLPNDFAQIPDSSDLAFVKSSVKGTDEAEDAALLASVPQKTAVDRRSAKLEVAYTGTPKFKLIENTSVSYAVNTTSDVFEYEDRFYACYQGVWFMSSSANGPWEVADSIPAALYSIPPSSPKHNVTYVKIYESTPTTVVTGYTSGYSGQYLMNGLVMFGAGVAVGAALNDDDIHWYYPAPYYSYGCAASYNYGWGGYYSSHTAYGPWGGIGRSSAYYNPWTGGYARSTAVRGPYGAAYAVEAYNPFTDTYAARAKGVSPYGAYSRGIIERDGNWVQGGRSVNQFGSAGWAETSEGGKAASYNKFGVGGRTTVAQSQNGDFYAGHDGNVYRKDSNGNWSQYGNGSWNNVTRPTVSENANSRLSAVNNTTSGSFSKAKSISDSFNQSAVNRSASWSQADFRNRGTLQSEASQRDPFSTLNSEASARSRSESLSVRAQQYRTAGSSYGNTGINRGNLSSGSFGGGFSRSAGGFRGRR